MPGPARRAVEPPVEAEAGEETGHRVEAGRLDGVVGVPDQEHEHSAHDRRPPADRPEDEGEEPAEDRLGRGRRPICTVVHAQELRHGQSIAQDDDADRERHGERREHGRPEYDREEVSALRAGRAHGREPGPDQGDDEAPDHGGPGESGVVGEGAEPWDLSDLAKLRRREQGDPACGDRPPQSHRGDDERKVERQDAVSPVPGDPDRAEQADGDPVPEADERHLRARAADQGDAAAHGGRERGPRKGAQPEDDGQGRVDIERG